MTPRDKVAAFIEKNLKAERDKYGAGARNSYFDWSDFKAELDYWLSASNEAARLTKENALMHKYLKECGRLDDFDKWKEGK